MQAQYMLAILHQMVTLPCQYPKHLKLTWPVDPRYQIDSNSRYHDKVKLTPPLKFLDKYIAYLKCEGYIIYSGIYSK